MKFILLAVTLLAVAVSANNYSGYIINYEQSGAIKPQAAQEQYSQQSLTDLLKHNFQVLSEQTNVVEDLVEDFGKGNLMNPVELNYLVVVEGKDNANVHPDNVRINVESSDESEKLLDSIFNASQDSSLLRLTQEFFPNEKRVPFYYYKSQAVQSESAYERAFGIELQRDVANNEVFFFDNQTQKQIGKKFNLQSAFQENFPQYRLQKDAIVKKNSALKLQINEDNVKEVETLLKDLVAVSQISKMFQQSASPNFVAFLLNFEALEQHEELVQDLQKSLFSNLSYNFAKTMGKQQTFGEVVYVSEMSQVETEKVQGFMIPRILLEQVENVEVGDDPEPTPTPVVNTTSTQIKAWFSLVFVIILYYVGYSLFTMNIQKDTLLYAKFIAGDAR